MLLVLGVMLPVAVSICWETRFRWKIVQRHIARNSRSLDSGRLKERLGPGWSYLLSSRLIRMWL